MRYGVIITGGTVAEQIELAAAAEAAGWDGVFTWDGIHVGDGMEVHDPWVLMSAFAMATTNVRIGAIIQPLARRRPWKVARESVTLDHVSHGRFVLCVGLGTVDDAGFAGVGEPTAARERAERLDEALAILDGLWSGERFGFDGRHYRFPPMAFRPTPIQQPRIPVWVVGAWPAERSMARAARWDGLIPSVRGGPVTPEAVAQMRDWIGARRDLASYDIAVEGTTAPGDDREPRAYSQAGATWWIESDWTATVDGVRDRIAAGPPRDR